MHQPSHEQYPRQILKSNILPQPRQGFDMHHQNILLAIVVLLIAISAAIPVTGSLVISISSVEIVERKPHLQSPLPNQSSCVAHDYSLSSATYTVQVGIDYADLHGCASIWETLKSVVGHGESGGIHDENYKCWKGDWKDQLRL
ncbi:hypothetical protein LTR78_000137 [Recurvomyces mirabilis]|uniref:Uncharacterized protein n=1 Tax=Recurvomyces mirabilis TaxID=574656 RepID=A0AAE1C6B3_9PEZI|nr:hypothetical protein LTR78_000137 [Recurvomyces mirabilis]KAK5161794.1 hypothetical protein LTS14_000139 [Recurvomyces mirabilis]